MPTRLIDCAPEVTSALEQGQAVVALESSLISNGLPWPENLETALDAQRAIRDVGGIPATIGVVGGRVRVGMSDSEIEALANSHACVKASRRDLAAAIVEGADAGTTVSATLAVARRVGISVLATGGIGGVHRGASESFDISTDLDELGRADGALVVCSGMKNLLDIPATMEVLESKGVLVVGYRTRLLPGFTAISASIPLDWAVHAPEEAAAVWRAHRAIANPGAVVLVNPVPASVALPAEEADTALARALALAAARKIRGKALTPFLLAQIREFTTGRSLAANRALIVANSQLAARVAVCGTQAGRE